AAPRCTAWLVAHPGIRVLVRGGGSRRCSVCVRRGVRRSAAELGNRCARGVSKRCGYPNAARGVEPDLREQLVALGCDDRLVLALRTRQLLHEKRAGRVYHLALAEGVLFVAAEQSQVSENTRDFDQG